MSKNPKRSRVAAVHEAGHAVASIALGIGFSEVVIYTSPEVTGRITSLGAVTGCTGEYPPIYTGMVALAGPVAQARYTKKGLLGTLLGGGISDSREVDDSVAMSEHSYE